VKRDRRSGDRVSVIHRLPIFKALLPDEHGVSAIEYGILAALISIAGMAALEGLGYQTGNTLCVVADAMAEGGGCDSELVEPGDDDGGEDGGKDKDGKHKDGKDKDGKHK
jgi:pilus assembly protein Flp/PilA